MDIFLKSVSALNDETRVLLLRFIDTNGEVCVCELQESLEMIQSRLSRHLKILKDAGFLRVDRKGTWAYYSIRSPLDKFRSEALKEIRHLPIELPELKKQDEKKTCNVWVVKNKGISTCGMNYLENLSIILSDLREN